MPKKSKDTPEQNNIARVPKIRTTFMHGTRPLEYDVDIAIEFCARIATGKSMRTVCLDDDMPRAVIIFRWLADTSNGFNKLYDMATEARTEADAEDIRDIADDGRNDWMLDKRGNVLVDREAIERSKLRVNTRQWLMGKRKPKKYGEKLDLTTMGEKLPTPILGGASIAPITKPEDK